MPVNICLWLFRTNQWSRHRGGAWSRFPSSMFHLHWGCTSWSSMRCPHGVVAQSAFAVEVDEDVSVYREHSRKRPVSISIWWVPGGKWWDPKKEHQEQETHTFPRLKVIGEIASGVFRLMAFIIPQWQSFRRRFVNISSHAICHTGVHSASWYCLGFGSSHFSKPLYMRLSGTPPSVMWIYQELFHPSASPFISMECVWGRSRAGSSTSSGPTWVF